MFKAGSKNNNIPLPTHLAKETIYEIGRNI
jgi:hypothetical protein